MATPPSTATNQYIYRTEASQGLRGRRATIEITALHIASTPSIKFNVVKMIMQQNFSPTWAEEQAYGKMDPIATYSHTKRTMKFHFTVWSQDEESLDDIAGNIETFAKFNYPTYIPGKTALLAPPFFEIQVLGGKYMPAMQGYISSINIVPGHSKGTVFGSDDDGDLEAEYAVNAFMRDRAYEVDFDFVVLHEVALGWVGNVFPDPAGGFMFAGLKKKTLTGATPAVTPKPVKKPGESNGAKVNDGTGTTKPQGPPNAKNIHDNAIGKIQK